MDRIFRGFCVVMSVIIVLSSVFMIFAAAGNTKSIDLFGCNDIVQNINNLEINMTSVIYVKNSDGNWTEYQRIHGNENRIWVDYDKIPKKLIDAFISIEDQRFSDHVGVDWKRTAGAFINYLPFVNIYSSNQGGSTITQQLIKNLTSDNDKSASRKFREIARALVIEKMLSKEQILEAYLNTISLGSGICGVQVASNYYFNKDVSQLTLTECACLAGITKNPSAYNPDTKPEGNKDRRQLVLKKMFELGKINGKEYSEAYNENVVIDKSQQSNFEIPINSYFVDALISQVIDDLSSKYGCSTDTASSMLYNGGYKIYATIDSDVQEAVDDVYQNVNTYFSQKSRKNSGKHVESAITIMDYAGHIVGLAGGTGEKTVNRGLNRATDSPRQPGSTMKPLGVYSQAIDKGYINYSSIYQDKAMDNYYGNGKKGPKEWYGYYAGKMTVQRALERSVNTIPCWILKDSVGIDNSYNFLKNKFHLNHLTDTDRNIASLALGGCQYGVTTTESAGAYAVFGNGGKYYRPMTYYKVERATGETVLEADKVGEQIISPATATVMNHLLQNVVSGSQGTGKAIKGYSKLDTYAKTGTSSDMYDLWMVAGSPYYVGSVWYGFDHQEDIYNSNAAANVWKAVMSKVHKGLGVKEFTDSTDVIEEKYCTSTGLLATGGCYSTRTGYYVPGYLPERCDAAHANSADYSSSSSQASSSSSSAPSSSSSTTSQTSENSSTSSSSSSSTTPSSSSPPPSSSESSTSSATPSSTPSSTTE